MRRLAPLLLAAVLHAGRADAVEVVVWEFGGLNQPSTARFLPNGDVLITDKWNGLVLDVAPSRPSGGSVPWQFAGVIAPDSARRLANGHTLIADPESERVLELDAAGTVVWSYGTGTNGCTDTELYFPSDLLDWSGDRLIVDQAHSRLLRVNLAGTVLWRYGDSACNAGTGPGQLSGPFAAELLPSGDILLSDVGDSWVVQIHPTGSSGGTVLWEYGTRGTAGAGPNQLSSPDRAVPLPDGHVLITDTDNERVIEVVPTPPFGGSIVWQYGTTGISGDGPGFLDEPYDAERGPLGSTLIADQFNNRVIEVSPLNLRLRTANNNYPVGSCAGPIQLQIEDVYQTLWSPLGNVSPMLSASSGSPALFADATCSSPLVAPSLTGTTGLTFYVADQTAEAVQIETSAQGYGSDALTLAFGSPASPNIEPQRFLVACGCRSSSGELPAMLLAAIWIVFVCQARRTGSGAR